jgi:hypothetical protein
MSNFEHTTQSHTAHADGHHLEAPRPPRRVSTETKASVKTSELVAYVAAVLGVLIASAIVDATDFGAQEAWFYVTLLTIGYMISRGLAKSGSRDFYTDDNR